MKGERETDREGAELWVRDRKSGSIGEGNGRFEKVMSELQRVQQENGHKRGRKRRRMKKRKEDRRKKENESRLETERQTKDQQEKKRKTKSDNGWRARRDRKLRR